MSNWNYIASTFKPTSVSDSIISNFICHSQRNLCVAKGETLEIYDLTSEKIQLIHEFSINSDVCSLVNLPGSAGHSDSILLLTYSKKIIHLAYSSVPIVLSEVNINTKSRKNEDLSPKIVLNFAKNLACVYSQRSYFTILQITLGKISETFIAAHQDQYLTDFSFVVGTNKLVVCYSVDKSTSALYFYDVLPVEQRIVQVGEVFPFEDKVSKVLSQPNIGPVVFFLNFFVFFDAECEEYSKKEYPINEITSVCQTENNKWVVSNVKGQFYLITIENKVSVDLLGTSSTTSSITYLDNNIFYLGSRFNNSKLIKVLENNNKNGDFLEEIQEFTNLGPILDMKVIKDHDRGAFDIITCSGIDSSGGLRKVSKGVALNEELSIDISNITGIWTISAISTEFHSHLFMSFINQTRIFEIVNSKIQPFPKNLTTLAHNTLLVNTFHDFIVHVVPIGVFVYNANWEVVFSQLSSAVSNGRNVVIACSFENYIGTVVGSNIICIFSIESEGFSQILKRDSEFEVSCLSIFQKYLVVGHWESKNLQILNFQGEIIYTETNSFTSVPRSVKFLNASPNLFMIVGLSDGTLLQYSLSSSSIELKKKFMIGYQGISLEEIIYKSKNYLFAICDSPVFVYFENNSIFTTNLRAKDISFACSFNTESFPGCLAIVSKSKFSVISLPELQEYSVTAYIKKMTVRRLVYLENRFVIMGLLENTRSCIQAYDNEKELLDSLEFPHSEFVNCIHAVNSKIFVGLQISENGDFTTNDKGKLSIYTIINDKIVFLNHISMNYLITCINSNLNQLIVGAHREIHLYQISENNLTLLDSSQRMTYVYYLDVFENLIAAADLIKSITIYRQIDNKLQPTHRNYSNQYTMSVCFISQKMLISGDSFGNLLILELLPTGTLKNISGFNIGCENINCIKRLSMNPNKNHAESVIFGTTKGRIGIVIGINEEKFKILAALLDCMKKELRTLDNCDGNKPRQEENEMNLVKFIKGDVAEEFLNLGRVKQSTLALMVSEITQENITAEKICNILSELVKLH